MSAHAWLDQAMRRNPFRAGALGRPILENSSIVMRFLIHMRINNHPVRLDDGAPRQVGRLQAALPHNVENSLAAGDEMIGDDAPVAAPPYGFRTHDRAPALPPLFDEMLKAGVKPL